MNNGFQVRCSLEIVKFSKLFLNDKRVNLLRNVKDKGSINAASRELGMSYQQAWHFISEMNEISPLPLVVRQRGGVNGGGASLTSFGEKSIQEYDKMCRQHESLNNKNTDKLWVCSLQ